MNICVEEPKSRVPFERRKLDLSIFSFDEPTNDNSFRNIIQEPLIDPSFEEIFGNELSCLGELVRDALVSYTHPVEFMDLCLEVIFEEELKMLGASIEDDPNRLGDGDDDSVGSVRRRKHRGKLRKARNKLERMRRRLNKRLTPNSSPLKRTH